MNLLTEASSENLKSIIYLTSEKLSQNDIFIFVKNYNSTTVYITNYLVV